jgi:hypothetical protein
MEGALQKGTEVGLRGGLDREVAIREGAAP